jgi:maleate cis-trans isomerase
MKFKLGRQHLNYVMIGFLTVLVTVMATSFVLRVAVAPPVSATIDNSIAKSNAQEVIQVNILNACGTKGLASKAKDYLRARGFDVVEIGNSEEMTNNSQIIDRLGDIKSAKQVAYALGIRDTMITSVIDSNMFLRATIIIGSDYQDLKPFRN